MSRLGGGERDDSGGWHDAGDYGKYTVNGAFAVGFLLKAYEHFPQFVEKIALDIPEKGGALPDMLDEAQVELKWLLKVQLDDGSFAHKVTALNFEGVVAPTADTQKRYFISPSSAGTADAVAALALAARLYRPFEADFADRCIDAAVRGQAWLDQNAKAVQPVQSDVQTGDYVAGGETDERLWALAELWETTGTASFLAALEDLLQDQYPDANFDWANVKNLGLSTYLRSAREGRDPVLVSRVASGFVQVADAHALYASADVHGRGNSAYYWGINGVLARLSFNLMNGYFVDPKAEYLDAIQLQIDHLFGLNVYARSFVSGTGANAVQKPHHRPSEADGTLAPWPGLLIGGPHSRFFADADGTNAPFPALTWTDEYSNYLHNEVAINWNTALAYALTAASAADEDAMGCAKCIIEGLGGSGGVGGASAR